MRFALLVASLLLPMTVTAVPLAAPGARASCPPLLGLLGARASCPPLLRPTSRERAGRPRSQAPAQAAPAEEPITPRETIRLFDGKTLDHFQTWLVGHHRTDPNRVFSVVDQVDGAPAIRISGQDWGGIVTTKRYANYRLVAEFRWGLLTWGNRRDRTRDSGILLHAQGPEGNYQADFNGPWMRSIEFQIIEGGVGDFILVGGYNQQGDMLRPSLTATVRKDRDGETVYDPQGAPAQLDRGRINWFGRDVDWTDKLGFRGREDVESPYGQWTRLEAICDGDRITYMVNGKVVNSGTRAGLKEGRLLFQSEGAELFFRRIDLEPLPARQ